MNYTMPAMNTLIDILQVPNQFTNNLFWNFIVLIVWLIIFVTFNKSLENPKSLSITFFITLILSSLLVWMGLAHPFTAGICLAGTVLSSFIGGGDKL